MSRRWRARCGCSRWTHAAKMRIEWSCATHVRLGARAQALRQYSLCRLILRDEFDAVPEPATERLFNLDSTTIPVESESG